MTLFACQLTCLHKVPIFFYYYRQELSRKFIYKEGEIRTFFRVKFILTPDSLLQINLIIPARDTTANKTMQKIFYFI